MQQHTDTIAAIATPPGRGGVGIIRVSGPKVHDIAESILDGNTLKPRRALLRRRPVATTYCYGESPTMADLYLVPQVMNGRRYKTDFTPFPLIVAIDEACRALPAFQAGMPENQPGYSE